MKNVNRSKINPLMFAEFHSRKELTLVSSITILFMRYMDEFAKNNNFIYEIYDLNEYERSFHMY